MTMMIKKSSVFEQWRARLKYTSFFMKLTAETTKLLFLIVLSNTAISWGLFTIVYIYIFVQSVVRRRGSIKFFNVGHTQNMTTLASYSAMQ